MTKHFSPMGSSRAPAKVPAAVTVSQLLGLDRPFSRSAFLQLMRDLRDADRGDFSANKQTERTPMQVWIDQHVEGGTAGYHELGAGGEQTPPVAWRDRRQRDRDLRAARRQVHRAAYVTALVELHEEGRVAFSEKSVQRNMDAIRWRAYLNVESAGKPWPQMKAPHPRTLLAWMRALLAIRDRTFLIGFRIQGE